MKILVTGGAGFLGANLCRLLLKQGHEVICLDSLITGKKENIKELMDNPNFKFVQQDITKPMDFEVKQIYDLACLASPPHYLKYPEETILTCTVGIKNLLDLADKNKARLLFTSSSEIYGDPKENPQKETYWGNVNSVGERACYKEGKRIAETWIMDRHRKKGTDIRIVRIFNTYGPFLNIADLRVVTNQIIFALKNQPVPVHGDGKQTRSFCYASDMCNGLYKMMNQDNFIGPVNLGNPKEISIIELAKKIIELTESKSEIEYQEAYPDDARVRCPDITLAKNKLNWEPKVDLEEGLKKTIEFYKDKV